MTVTPADVDEHSERLIDQQDARSNNAILKAISALDLHQHHETIHEPNDLTAFGLPAHFLSPLISVYDSSGRYQYLRCGIPVQEIIGISHLDLIYALADYLGVPSEIGLGFTGRGFAINAKIEVICEILSRKATLSYTAAGKLTS
jgi:hypothetical protein